MLQNVPADLDLHVTLLGKEWRLDPSAKDLRVYMNATSFDPDHKKKIFHLLVCRVYVKLIG